MRAFYRAFVLTLVIFIVSCRTGVEPMTDWDRAVRVDADVRDILKEQSQRAITKPITLYEAMAYALKYNMDRRLSLMEEALAVKNYNISDLELLPNIAVNAGFKARSNKLAYKYRTASGETGVLQHSRQTTPTADVQVAWNVLDFGMSYYQAKQDSAKGLIVRENRRKIIHSLLQDVRSGYWKALTAQRVLPEVDILLENTTIAVEKLAIKSEEDANQNEIILKQRAVLLEIIRDLRALKQELQEAHKNFTELLGLLPNTNYTLIGSENGNYTLPAIRTRLARIEWLALMNRPEARVEDYQKTVNSFESKKAILGVMPELEMLGSATYEDNPFMFNKTWAEAALKIGFNLLNPAKLKAQVDKAKVQSEIADAKRTALTMAVLAQVHLAWGRYMASRDNYEIEEELSKVLDLIAENAVKEIEDEAIYSFEVAEASSKAMLASVRKDMAFAELQDATGDVFVTIGLDPFPEHLTARTIPEIAKVLADVMKAWNYGRFTPEDMPKVTPVPSARPPVDVGVSLPNVSISEAEVLVYKVPENVFDIAKLGDEIIYTAELADGRALPRWLYFDGISCTFSGQPRSYIGRYDVIVKAHNTIGEAAFVRFAIDVRKGFVPRVDIIGSNRDNKVTVIDYCRAGDACENYVVKKYQDKPREVIVTPTVPQPSHYVF